MSLWLAMACAAWGAPQDAGVRHGHLGGRVGTGWYGEVHAGYPDMGLAVGHAWNDAFEVELGSQAGLMALGYLDFILDGGAQLRVRGRISDGDDLALAWVGGLEATAGYYYNIDVPYQGPVWRLGMAPTGVAMSAGSRRIALDLAVVGSWTVHREAYLNQFPLPVRSDVPEGSVVVAWTDVGTAAVQWGVSGVSQSGSVFGLSATVGVRASSTMLEPMGAVAFVWATSLHGPAWGHQR